MPTGPPETRLHSCEIECTIQSLNGLKFDLVVLGRQITASKEPTVNTNEDVKGGAEFNRRTRRVRNSDLLLEQSGCMGREGGSGDFGRSIYRENSRRLERRTAYRLSSCCTLKYNDAVGLKKPSSVILDWEQISAASIMKPIKIQL